jgi:hypothetical protein
MQAVSHPRTAFALVAKSTPSPYSLRTYPSTFSSLDTLPTSLPIAALILPQARRHDSTREML